ncbi:FadR/GntR family transcriptional regulator [Nitratireductor indicus]|uniref:GntR family transcriptional regulator n=1 Tax=Nitratireductor indicus C115 TaxID=1231190 RepID=K2PGH3_9HYPH|nr:FadR/GntR family transcriptional regulator [Nitratireductor indicus]EKF40137.1 GntR family transcriptional regulator [Nitratireductor indicus C115]MDS1138126.1 FadR/GntR family transcriptional regulator [Nitratireductor indicus]SFQ81360.1 DNA-binding transcriptional regulator, FadR family [Nitratireductor indicus]
MLGRRESLSSQLKKQILQKIDDKVYLPGERIPSESDLCAEFGVSRTVVREAVASLRADGVLKSRQGIGVFVDDAPRLQPFEISPIPDDAVQEILHILELRLSVELEAAAMAAERRSQAQLEQIANALEKLRAEGNGQSGPMDFDFHLAIARATNNPYFEKFLTFLGPQIIPRLRINAIGSGAQSGAYHDKLQEEHHAILDAIEKKDSAGARDAMRRHLSGSLTRYRQSAA